jgi:hypothetical protein
MIFNHTRRLALTANLIGFAGFIAAPANAQGEECVAIDSNVARLECFDTLFSTKSTAANSIVDAIDILWNHTASIDRDEEIELTHNPENPCNAEFIYKGIREVSPGYKKQFMHISTVDLSKVEYIAGWETDERGFISLDLHTEPKHDAKWQYFESDFSSDIAPSDIKLADLKTVRGTSGRITPIYLLSKIYYDVKEDIRLVLHHAVAACRQ